MGDGSISRTPSSVVATTVGSGMADLLALDLTGVGRSTDERTSDRAWDGDA
jgi:hypothetical protein